MMVTNPNTCGLFEKDIKEIVRQAENWWKEIVKIHKVDIIIIV